MISVKQSWKADDGASDFDRSTLLQIKSRAMVSTQSKGETRSVQQRQMNGNVFHFNHSVGGITYHLPKP